MASWRTAAGNFRMKEELETAARSSVTAASRKDHPEAIWADTCLRTIRNVPKRRESSGRRPVRRRRLKRRLKRRLC
jgi:hypothetical protein